MNDQVKDLSGNYISVATLNSEITANEKKRIIDQVKSGEINILYLSPELLLSYSINSFIGERTIGLVVVDEAHTVTTWGRDFRVDYWFLGDYLRKTKRILKQNFPIFALTATAVWDLSGKNDMVFDTIRSLHMSPCIKYIGVVRRENIIFDIEQSNITKNYEEKRLQLTNSRIKEFIFNKHKSIVYFPYRRTIQSLLNQEEINDLKDKIVEYHSWVSPIEKKRNTNDFKSGFKPIMCATKAFGMGVDVSDITMVYHHAPSGGLTDYIQEIGRLARNPLITVIAKIDFSITDFRYRNTLFWLSSIKLYQLKSVIKKLMALYRMNGEKRNMLISSSDFEYIFPNAKSNDDYDKSLKSCLMLISNDLHNKLGFNALIVRPKSLFSKCYIRITNGLEKDFHRIYKKYVKRLNEGDRNIFILDADTLWNEQFSNISFPDFKRKLLVNKIFKDFTIECINKVELECKNDIKDTHYKLCDFFQSANKCLDYMASTHHRLKTDDLIVLLPQYNDIQKETFWESFKLIYTTNHNADNVSYCTIKTKKKNGSEEIQLEHQGYEKEQGLYMNWFTSLIKKREILEFCNSDSNIIKLAELLSSLGLADYQRLGGDTPVIFIRINNPFYFNDIIRKNYYENGILKDIKAKFDLSENIFTHFFTTPFTNKQRWDYIESYFLGASFEELQDIK